MNIYNALIYKKLYGGGGGGEIEVESLTATENKTYNAGEGKAYNPVVVAIPEPTLISKNITANGTYTASSDNADGYSSVSVNVPLPSNAYLLQSIEHESIATFADGTDNFLKSLEVAIEPVQSGSGEPSPTNIRPISGWDECKVTVADDLENPTVSNVYTIDLNGTRYGGKLDVMNGVLTVNKVSVVYDGSNDESWGYSASWSKTNTNAFYLPGDATIKFSSWDDYPISKCNCLTPMSRNELYDADTTGIGMSGSLDGGNVSIRVPKAVSDVSELRTWLSSNNVQAVYELATPQTVQLSPTIIKSLQGDNNFFASTGEIEWMQYWGKEVIS